MVPYSVLSSVTGFPSLPTSMKRSWPSGSSTSVAPERGPREDHAGDAAVASVGIVEGVLLHVALKAGNRIRKGRGVVGAPDGDGDVLLDDLAAFDLHLHLEGFGLDVAIVHGLDELRAVFGQRIGILARFPDRCSACRAACRPRPSAKPGLPLVRPRQAAADILGIDPAAQRQLSGDGGDHGCDRLPKALRSRRYPQISPCCRS